MQKRSVQKQASPFPGVDRRAAILDAAQGCFWRSGIKRTAIEDVAREAGVAKGTVYLYFSSKDDLFASLARELCADALGRVRSALAAPGPLARRLAAALDAKIGHFHRLLSGSPNAAELLESKATIAAEPLAALDHAFRKALDRALSEAGIGSDARARAETLDLVLAAAYGTAQHGELRGETSPEAYRARLQRHLDLLLSGLGRRPAPRTKRNAS